MTKLYRSPVQVELDARAEPRRFRWLGRWHRILKCALDEEGQHLWSKLRTPEPKRYRCETYQGLVCDLCFARESGTWVLERVWD
ncbi:hypothetical protein Psch_00039 [Pelotomaculum schinkii]|uniref:Uncharacterized protein n=1 Tax=Pelotomaculum schinkii TaxID=78350 RepID=A0A4Y7RDV0_9FIRM|nr:hypothetical protein [Pelotomaculum schinkii]TEB06507.1 hypothetical protein Psch_00039 [Pelotomaculum schinkii]